MKKLALSALICSIAVSSTAQTVMIDYAEKINEDKATIHYLEPKGEPDSEDFESIEDGKKKLLAIFESYRADGYELMTSNVTTHKQGRSLHYHYQYILQNAQPNVLPPEPPQPFTRPINDSRGSRQDDNSMNGAPSSPGDGMSPSSGGGSGGGGSSMRPPTPEGKKQRPAPPSEEELKPSEPEAGTPPSPPSSRSGASSGGDGESGSSDEGGRKIPNPPKGSIKTGPK